jgi:hypothetical protein
VCVDLHSLEGMGSRLWFKNKHNNNNTAINSSRTTLQPCNISTFFLLLGLSVHNRKGWLTGNNASCYRLRLSVLDGCHTGCVAVCNISVEGAAGKWWCLCLAHCPCVEFTVVDACCPVVHRAMCVSINTRFQLQTTGFLLPAGAPGHARRRESPLLRPKEGCRQHVPRVR